MPEFGPSGYEPPEAAPNQPDQPELDPKLRYFVEDNSDPEEALTGNPLDPFRKKIAGWDTASGGNVCDGFGGGQVGRGFFQDLYDLMEAQGYTGEQFEALLAEVRQRNQSEGLNFA